MEDFNKTPKIDEPSVITLGTGDRLAEPFANLKKNQSDHWSINGRIINEYILTTMKTSLRN